MHFWTVFITTDDIQRNNVYASMLMSSLSSGFRSTTMTQQKPSNDVIFVYESIIYELSWDIIYDSCHEEFLP